MNKIHVTLENSNKNVPKWRRLTISCNFVTINCSFFPLSCGGIGFSYTVDAISVIFAVLFFSMWLTCAAHACVWTHIIFISRWKECVLFQMPFLSTCDFLFMYFCAFSYHFSARLNAVRFSSFHSSTYSSFLFLTFSLMINFQKMRCAWVSNKVKEERHFVIV